MIRNIIFLLVFYLGLIFFLILFIPALILPKYLVVLGGKILGYWTLFCLKFIMATKIEVKGIENILNNPNLIFSHENLTLNNYYYKLKYEKIDEAYLLSNNLDKRIVSDIKVYKI